MIFFSVDVDGGDTRRWHSVGDVVGNSQASLEGEAWSGTTSGVELDREESTRSHCMAL